MIYIVKLESKAVQDIEALKKSGNKSAIIKIKKLLSTDLHY